jgi:hypothetical protein
MAFLGTKEEKARHNPVPEKFEEKLVRLEPPPSHFEAQES